MTFTENSLSEIYCIDVEASALGESGYPIEIGIANVSTGETKSWLIKPTKNWITHGLWSDEAAAIHHITRGELASNGMEPLSVAEELSRYSRDSDFLSDHIKNDGFWISKLWNACPTLFTSALPVADFWDRARRIAEANHRDADGILDRAMVEALRRFPAHHRAAVDARRNAEVIRILGNLSPQ